MQAQIIVITDSSASLPSAPPEPIVVVPLRVLAGGAVADDQAGGLPEAIARELRGGERLSTARPAPEQFAAAYAAAAAGGAPEIVSVHLSGELSGTLGSARLAAATAPVPVHVVDSRSVGAGLGIVAVAAARAAAAGQPGRSVAEAAIRRSARIGSFFALDSQEQLRAGGRLGAAQLDAVGDGPRAGPGRGPGGGGGMMRSRPVLHLQDGRIVVLERVRTQSAAADRLTELAAGFAAGHPCQVVVQHLDSPAAAADLARQLAGALPAAGPISVLAAGTAILAHTGPGLLGVVVAPLE
ncbi:MAG TPA: DegV family protein [Streptosporangiaceae bacterium]|jgi:fatty acid-binding protein DegV